MSLNLALIGCKAAFRGSWVQGGPSMGPTGPVGWYPGAVPAAVSIAQVRPPSPSTTHSSHIVASGARFAVLGLVSPSSVLGG